mgnify:CR=1 FL=1
MAGELVEAREVLAVGQRLELFFENSEEGASGYMSRIEDIVGDDLVVAMPVDGRSVPALPHEGENLYVLAAGHGCHFRFFSVYRGRGRYNKDIPVLHISMPDVAERFQKRELFRVKVDLTATVRLVSREGKIDAPRRAKVVDLSGSGLSFLWPRGIPPYTDAALEINDLPGIGSLELMSRVVRCTQVEREDNTLTYQVGVQFQGLSRGMRDKIVRYLFHVQRAQAERVKND